MTAETPIAGHVDEERVFRALSDAHRRDLLDLLHERDGQTLSELDSHLPMTRFGTMKHLRMLESAGLVVTRRAGRKKLHYLNPGPIRTVYDHWIRKYTAGGAPGARAEGAELPEPEGRIRGALRHAYEVVVRTSPMRLWEAITSPELTREYFYGARVRSDWKPGASLIYSYPDGRVAAEGTVLEVTPPRRLVYTFSALWDEAVARDRAHRVIWTLQPMGPVCRVVMENADFEGETATYRSVRERTLLILNGLKTLLETGEPLSVGA
jgi:uncharacterized protein YndB with AHSA1/START domain/DNA-binding transcriptional ArsR family regulator